MRNFINGPIDTAVADSRRSIVPIEEESSWRQSTRLHRLNDQPALAVGRWSQRFTDPHEVTAHPLNEHYTVDILLGHASLDCYADGRHIKSGAAEFGATQVTAPGQQVRCRFNRSVEAIHLFVPRSLIVSTYEDMTQSSCPCDFQLHDPCFAPSRSIGMLAAALSDTRTVKGDYATFCSDSLSTALLYRFMAMQVGKIHDIPAKSGLALWRLRRATEYIQANLGKPITLQEMAQHTGLSRMHFSAQFKLSTGMTPHTFVLHQRLQRAKELLSSTRRPLVDIALDVGFQSQSHFSTVFRKLTGTTPRRWRSEALAHQDDG